MVGRMVGTTLALTLAATMAMAESTVTFTNPDGTLSSTVPLGATGTFEYRIQTPVKAGMSAPIASVAVTSKDNQIAAACYDMGNDQTIAVTSEEIIITHYSESAIIVTARSHMWPDCENLSSEDSNPIIVNVEFVPQSPTLVAP